MHPCRTALIGLVLFGITNAQNPHFVNGNLYAQGDIIDAAADETPYWWMNKASPFKRSYPAAGAVNDAGSPIDVSNNPFLSGNSLSSGNNNNYAGAASTPQQQQPIDVSNNPFLSGGGRPFSAAPSTGPYSAPGYLPPDQNVQTIPCNRQGQACVAKYLCSNGYVDSNQVFGSSQVRYYISECVVTLPRLAQ